MEPHTYPDADERAELAHADRQAEIGYDAYIKSGLRSQAYREKWTQGELDAALAQYDQLRARRSA